MGLSICYHARAAGHRQPPRLPGQSDRRRRSAALSLPRQACRARPERGRTGVHQRPEGERMRGGDLIAEYLIGEKVPYVFGLCGHGIVGLMDALEQRADRIRMIGVHHEQVAGYMADAYYRVTHRPAATFTSCGPGSVNLTIALACAMMDSSALVAITGNV